MKTFPIDWYKYDFGNGLHTDCDGNVYVAGKEQRLKILEKRMDNYYKLQENKEVIEEQLQTIEEMVEYIKDQPISVQNTEREDVMIENLLFETEQTQQTMEEIESLMQSEFYPGVVDDFDLGGSNKEFGDSLTE